MKRIRQEKKIVRIKIIPLQCLKNTIPATDHKSMIYDIFTTDFYTFKKKTVRFYLSRFKTKWHPGNFILKSEFLESNRWITTSHFIQITNYEQKDTLWLFGTTQRYDEIKNHFLLKELLIDILLKRETRENKLLIRVLNLFWNIKKYYLLVINNTWTLVNNTYALSLEIKYVSNWEKACLPFFNY